MNTEGTAKESTYVTGSPRAEVLAEISMKFREAIPCGEDYSVVYWDCK